MPIIADIDDLSAAEFLLMLSLNRKTGKVTGISGSHKVIVAFRNGSVVYAASTAVRERIGSILVGRKLVSEEDLQAAIEQQQAEPDLKHLGNILVEMGTISQDALAEVVRSQFQRVLGELLSWPDGVLTFTRMEIPDLGAVHVNTREILLDMGFETEQLVLGTISALEDTRRDSPPRPPTPARPAAEAPPIEASTPPPPPAADAQAILRSIMDEMQSLSISITAEMNLGMLTRAVEVVERAVLFLVSPERLTGVGGFGVERGGESADTVVRQLVIPRAHDSVFTSVIKSRRTYRGRLQPTAYNQHLIEHLGGTVPQEVVAIPIVVRGEVAAILYGDSASTGGSIGALGALEEAAVQMARTIDLVQDRGLSPPP